MYRYRSIGVGLRRDGAGCPGRLVASLPRWTQPPEVYGRQWIHREGLHVKDGEFPGGIDLWSYTYRPMSIELYLYTFAYRPKPIDLYL